MMAPKLEWKLEESESGFHRIVANPISVNPIGHGHRRWKICVDLNSREEADYEVFGPTRLASSVIFTSVADAKSWCQAKEDEAWVAANPPREYTDTEILDAAGGTEIRIEYDSRTHPATFRVKTLFDFPASIYCGPSLREAVTAYLRANSTATTAEPTPEPTPTPAEPEANEEPEPACVPANEPAAGREMTLGEFEAKCREMELLASFDPDDSANVWLSGHTGTPMDCYAPTLSEALAKCLAAIEAAKSPAAQPGREAAR